MLQLLTVRVDAVECRRGDDRNFTLTKRTLGGELLLAAGVHLQHRQTIFDVPCMTNSLGNLMDLSKNKPGLPLLQKNEVQGCFHLMFLAS